VIFLPATRPWAIEPVMAALNASDIPKEAYLLLDAPGCGGWYDAFVDSGWQIKMMATGNPEPPEDYIERRTRHLAMRRLSQGLTRQFGRVLYLEDDTLVPPETWGPLNRLLDLGYLAASGVQRGRRQCRACGIWRADYDNRILDPFEPEGITEADAVGHYCLLTYGNVYANLPIDPGPGEPVDAAHTRHMAPIAVDTAVWCGHLLESGEIIR